MVRLNWKILFGAVLLAVAIGFFTLHYLLFHDLYWLEEYIIFYLGMMPLEVILVTLVLDQLMEARERRERLEKMNMVIGVFFSEIGVELLRKIASRDPEIAALRPRLEVANSSNDADFVRLREEMKGHKFKSATSPADLHEIKNLVSSHRSLLVQLLENPILLEHEDFTSLLRAVFHLAEELDYRKTVDRLPESDYVHLAGDAARAYGLLTLGWLSYLRHLKAHYPYLYSLSVRTNPFKEEAAPIVRQ